MIWKKSPAGQRDWLDGLWRRLVWHFPAPQVKDILADYREQFEAGHDHCRTEAEIIAGLGTPEEVLGQLLEEEPTAKTTRLRTSGMWGAALALCLAFLWVCFSPGAHLLLWVGSCTFLAAFGAVLFLLLRGPARVMLEREISPERTISPVPVYGIPFALVLLFEVAEQILFVLAQAGRLPDHIGGLLIGDLNTYYLLALEAVLALLAAWLIFRSVTVSVRYFPGIIHTIGAMGTLFFTYVYLHSTIVTGVLTPSIDLLLRLLPYFVGLAISRVFQKWVDGGKPLPFLLQAKDGNQQDWLHRLGVHLLSWYPAGQALEILEDYQEQFELGKERGKSEASLISNLGRPETVVRDLLAEDRKVRTRRRQRWPWVVMLAVAGYLLLGVLRAFEFGGIGLHIFYRSPVAVSNAALVLGTVSLFVLLHVRNRAAVEARFPARRIPTVWVFLVPLPAFALTIGYCLYLIQLSTHYWPVEVALWNKPISWYLIDIIEFSTLTLLFLLIWTLARCFSGSIRYLPAAICSGGSLTSILCAGIFISAMDIAYFSMEDTFRSFLPVLLPYLTGIVLALAIWLFIRAAGKPRKEG